MAFSPLVLIHGLLLLNGLYIISSVMVHGFDVVHEPPVSFLIVAGFIGTSVATQLRTSSSSPEDSSADLASQTPGPTIRPLEDDLPGAPATMAQLFRTVLTTLRANYWRFATIGAWGLVASSLALAVVGAFDIQAHGELPQTAQDMVTAPYSHPLQFILTVVSFVGLAAPIAVIVAMVHVMAGGADLRQWGDGLIYRAALGRLLPFLGTVILMALATVPLLIVLPAALYLLVRWSVALVAVSVEPISPIGAMRRSWHLTRGQFWPALAIAGIGLVVNAGLALLQAQLVGSAARAIGEPIDRSISATMASAAVEGLFEALTTPIALALFVVLYWYLQGQQQVNEATEFPSPLPVADGRYPAD